MAHAVLFPDAVDKGGRGKKKTSGELSGFSQSSLQHARLVLTWAPELVNDVLEGAKPLNAAYAVALERKGSGSVSFLNKEPRFSEVSLSKARPILEGVFLGVCQV